MQRSLHANRSHAQPSVNNVKLHQNHRSPLTTPSRAFFLVAGLQEGTETLKRQITSHHALVMHHNALNKFPESKLRNQNTKLVHYGTPSNDDDFFTLMSAITSYHDASALVPSSAKSSTLHIPRDRLPDLISLENVKKTISLPLYIDDSTFNSTQKLCLNHHRILGNACDDSEHQPQKGPLQRQIDRDEKKLFFNVHWTCQSTPVDMGMNGYQLDLSVDVPVGLATQLVTRLGAHAQGKEYIKTLHAIEMDIPESHSDLVASTNGNNTDNNPKDSSPSHRRYALVNHYGSSFHEPSSTASPWMFPLLIKTWREHTPSAQFVRDTQGSGAAEEEVNVPMKSMYTYGSPYSMMWWVAHALSHPSNMLFDRLTIEMMPGMSTAEEFNQETERF